MPTWGELLPFVLLGLLGSLHCAGMCGGFAVTVALTPAGDARRRALARSLLYVLGKSLSYAVLGLVAVRASWLLTHGGAVLAGGSPAEHAATFEVVRRAMAWVAGAAFVVFALSALGLPVLPRVLRSGAPRPRMLGFLFDSVRSLPGHARGFGLGVANGLLPCGLSWAALALAVGGGELRGALGLFLFGLSTAPVLLLVGLGGASIPPRLRTRLAPLAAPLILVFAVLTVLRAGAPGGDGTSPVCCQEAPAGVTSTSNPRSAK